MQPGKLTPLQWQILQLLSQLEPPFTLTGGAALSGVHLKHRTTRDLDLFWRQRTDLRGLGDRAQDLLREAGLDVAPLQGSPGFERLRVADQTEACIVDLIAEPSAALQDPEELILPDRSVIRVDTRRVILANKLCTLLSQLTELTAPQ